MDLERETSRTRRVSSALDAITLDLHLENGPSRPTAAVVPVLGSEGDLATVAISRANNALPVLVPLPLSPKSRAELAFKFDDDDADDEPMGVDMPVHLPPPPPQADDMDDDHGPAETAAAATTPSGKPAGAKKKAKKTPKAAATKLAVTTAAASSNAPTGDAAQLYPALGPPASPTRTLVPVLMLSTATDVPPSPRIPPESYVDPKATADLDGGSGSGSTSRGGPAIAMITRQVSEQSVAPRRSRQGSGQIAAGLLFATAAAAAPGGGRASAAGGHSKFASESGSEAPSTHAAPASSAAPDAMSISGRSRRSAADLKKEGAAETMTFASIFAPTKFTWSVQRGFSFALFLILASYDIVTDILVFSSTYAYVSVLDATMASYRTTILVANTSFTNISATFDPTCTSAQFADATASYTCYLAETVCVQNATLDFVQNFSMPVTPTYTDPDFWVVMDSLTGGTCFYTDLFDAGKFEATVASLRVTMWICLAFVVIAVVCFVLSVRNSWKHRHYGASLLVFDFSLFLFEDVPQLAIQLLLLAQRTEIDCLLCIITSQCGDLGTCVALPSISTASFNTVVDVNTAFAALQALLQNSVVLLYMSLAGIAFATIKLTIRSLNFRPFSLWMLLYIFFIPIILCVFWLPLLWTLYVQLLPALGLAASTISAAVFIMAVVASVLAPFVFTLIFINVRASLIHRFVRASTNVGYDYHVSQQSRASLTMLPDSRSFVSRASTIMMRKRQAQSSASMVADPPSLTAEEIHLQVMNMPSPPKATPGGLAPPPAGREGAGSRRNSGSSAASSAT